MHGGTLTDIAVHGIDLVQGITGRRVATVVGARAWSTGRAPHIKDAAQCMLELEGGVGVMGDVSYLAPESIDQGGTPLYWRVTNHGTNGVLVSHGSPSTLVLYSNDNAVKHDRLAPFFAGSRFHGDARCVPGAGDHRAGGGAAAGAGGGAHGAALPRRAAAGDSRRGSGVAVAVDGRSHRDDASDALDAARGG